MFTNLTIIPTDSAEVNDYRVNRDQQCYTQGKEDALEKLKRDPSVYYSEQRDIDMYNMGYSYGERL